MTGSNINQKSWSCKGWFIVSLWMVIQCFVQTPAFSAEEKKVCNVALQEEAYNKYLTLVDTARVERIQRELNQISDELQLPFGSVTVDGVLGAGTREALYQYCGTLKRVAKNNFITNLVMNLDSQTASLTRDSGRVNISEKVTDIPMTDFKLKDGPSVWYQLDEKGLTSLIKKNSQPDTAMNEEQEKNRMPVISIPAEEDLAKLEQLLGVPYVNRNQFVQAVLMKMGIGKGQHDEFIAELVGVATKEASSKLKSIIVSDNGCGCVREFSSTVYGFYPYWYSTISRKSEGSEVQPVNSEIEPVIDYSIFNRIAYYGLTLNENGEISAPLHWSLSGKLGNFINKARRHKTAVDLVVYTAHWPQWTESTMQASVMSVYNQLMLQVEYKQTGIKQYVPFLNTTTASPDGVTLHFNRFFDNPSARYKIVEFVNQLYERLDDLDRDYKINILLDVGISELQGNKRLLSDIKSLLVSSASGAPAYVNSLLVFIDEPTTDTKKLLRSKIENEFKGAQRMEVLRKVIPVISPSADENDERGAFAQFDDDLFYFQNNFSGIGLWPMPMATDKDMPELTRLLIKVFGAAEVEGWLNSLSNRYPSLCEVACPNRWAFRLGFDLLLLLALVYGVLAMISRRVRRFYNRNAPYFILYLVVTALVFLVSLTCDPFWKQKRDIVFLGLLLLTSAIFMISKYSRAKQGPLP